MAPWTSSCCKHTESHALTNASSWYTSHPFNPLMPFVSFSRVNVLTCLYIYLHIYIFVCIFCQSLAQLLNPSRTCRCSAAHLRTARLRPAEGGWQSQLSEIDFLQFRACMSLQFCHTRWRKRREGGEKMDWVWVKTDSESLVFGEDERKKLGLVFFQIIFWKMADGHEALNIIKSTFFSFESIHKVKA